MIIFIKVELKQRKISKWQGYTKIKPNKLGRVYQLINWNPDFSNLKERRVKLHCFTEGRRTPFGKLLFLENWVPVYVNWDAKCCNFVSGNFECSK